MACKDPFGVLSDVSMGGVCIGDAFVSTLSAGGLPTVQPAVLAGFGPSQVFSGPIVCSGGIAGGLTITTPAASATTIVSGQQGFGQVYTDALVVAKTSAYGTGITEVPSLQVRMYNDGNYLNGLQTGLLVETHRNGEGLFLKANGVGVSNVSIQQSGPSSVNIGNAVPGSDIICVDPIISTAIDVQLSPTLDAPVFNNGISNPSKVAPQFFNPAFDLSRWYGVPLPKAGSIDCIDNQGNGDGVVPILIVKQGATVYPLDNVGNAYVVVPPGTRAFEFVGWEASGSLDPNTYLFNIIWGTIISLTISGPSTGFVVEIDSSVASLANPTGCFPFGSFLFAAGQGGLAGVSVALSDGWNEPCGTIPAYCTARLTACNDVSTVGVRVF
jgi:hypothetical protein